MKVTVLYGTETGNAEMCADAVAAHLRGTADVEVHDLADVGTEVLGADGLHVFVTSTFGEGDLPAGADVFFKAVDDERPDLGQLSFAVFGLGDSYYDGTFNQGSQIVAQKLTALGATQVGEIGCYDTSTGEPPEEAALAWLEMLPLLQEV